MTKSDILHAAALYGSRFVAWLDFIIDEEASWRNGMIIPEDDHDGEGICFCGLTQKSDGLDLVNLSPSWVAGSYYNGKEPYWKPVAGLPAPLAECLANWRVNMGIAGSTRLLQRFVGLPADGVLGPATIAAAVAVTNPAAATRQLVSAADARYRAIVAANPARAYALGDWLRRDQHLLARFVDDSSSAPSEGMAILATPAVPRAPRPRSLEQILQDLTVTRQIMT